MHGPIDYIIVGFKGNKFDGSILKAIGDAIENGTIGLVAFKFVQKDADGTVTNASIVDDGDELVTQFTQKYTGNDSLVDEDDISEVADLLQDDTSAGLLIIEQLWAKPLKEALIKAEGVLIAEGRIHPDAAAEIDKEEEK